MITSSEETLNFRQNQALATVIVSNSAIYLLLQMMYLVTGLLNRDGKKYLIKEGGPARKSIEKIP
jgi:hypothetical protein